MNGIIYNYFIRPDVPLLGACHGTIPEKFKFLKLKPYKNYAILYDPETRKATRILETDFIFTNNDGWYMCFAPWHFKSIELWYELLLLIESDPGTIMLEESWEL